LGGLVAASQLIARALACAGTTHSERAPSTTHPRLLIFFVARLIRLDGFLVAWRGVPGSEFDSGVQSHEAARGERDGPVIALGAIFGPKVRQRSNGELEKNDAMSKA
jgi:hypothetical protein